MLFLELDLVSISVVFRDFCLKLHLQLHLTDALLSILGCESIGFEGRKEGSLDTVMYFGGILPVEFF